MLWPVVKALLGHYRRYPLQIILVWLGLTLGVSLLVGVTSINQHAKQSYETGEKLFQTLCLTVFVLSILLIKSPRLLYPIASCWFQPMCAV